MKKQSGFAAVELVVALVLIAAIGGVGYYVWHNHSAKAPTTATATTAASGSSYTSPTVTAPAAPQVTSPSDLNSAMQVLNQTSVGSSAADSSQLTTQANGF